MTALQNGIELNSPDYSGIACLKATYLNGPAIYLPGYLNLLSEPEPLRTIAPQFELNGIGLSP